MSIGNLVPLNPEDVLPPAKAAKRLGISRVTLWRWVKAGKITPIMLDHAHFHVDEVNRVREVMGKK